VTKNNFPWQVKKKLKFRDIKQTGTGKILSSVSFHKYFQEFHMNWAGGVLPYMGYIGMSGPKGYGFSAILVKNRVSIFALYSSIL